MHVALNQHVHHYYLATPPHRCKLPEGMKEEDALPTVLMAGKGSSLLQKESPREPRVVYSNCQMYVDPRLHRKGTMSCVYGYVFTLQAAEWSIVAEWGLVCERVWIKHWVVTSYLIGLVIGGLLFGFLADRFGRRNLLVVCVTTVGSLGLALHFVRRLVVFLCLRFIQAIFVQGVYVTSWTLSAELFPPKWRCRALVAGGMAKPLGVALGALIALMVQHWRAVQLATSLPMIISLLYCWMIPESLRWLLTRGKTRRARLVAAQLARHNLLTLPPTAHAQMDHLAAHVYLDAPWGSLLTLFKTPRLRRHTLIVVFMWLAVSLADTSFRNELAGLGGPPGQLVNLLGSPGHLGSLLGAGVEAGAVVLAVVLTTQLYRRAFLVLSFLLTAAVVIVVICVLQLVKETSMDVHALATGLRFLGVLIVGGARVGVVVVSVEVTPTTARASAVGLCAAHAAMGEVLAPLLALVAELTYPSVPWLTSAGGCLIAALLTLFLPETAGTTLPDVVDESEVVGLGSRGDLLKACDGQYGKSPYWPDDDHFVFGRGAVSDAGPNDDGDKFKSLDRNLDCRWVRKASGRGDEEVRQLPQAAGPSQVMVLPHVQTRRRGMKQNLSRSIESLASSCSRCSIVSLVDVSKVNGNNSDTTDTTDSNYREDQKETRGQVLATGAGAEENIYTETTEVGEQKDTTASFKDKENVAGEKSASLTEKITCGKRHEEPEDDEAEADEELKTFATSGPLESDVSISVCSLQFKHIRRPVSPTDRRRGSGLYYSSSSAYETSSRRSLIQEYISRNSFRGDTSGSRYATLFRKKEPAKEKADGGGTTKPSYILRECIRIARDEERLGGLQGDASKRTIADLRSPFQHHSNPTSSRVIGASSSATNDTVEPNLFRRSFPSDGSSSTANNFTPSSTLEYEAGGGSRSQMTARTLRYDTLEDHKRPRMLGESRRKVRPSLLSRRGRSPGTKQTRRS
ncbi:LOW QUALITY PROTEIN: uncharacterized protein [Panulirus ornatus]|uniref:LOW QUALITY PROTEIN: uncharacterized protein n=1 Tax=Panulirus ornatus TaxID=150431 RepID=UPI003A8880DD